MKPILYPASEVEFVNNGLGRLSEATKCLVTEERNGQYELEMVYPITGLHYADICEERIIAARHDDSGDIQPFRIYKITRPMNGMVTVYARHISYQLSKVTVTPFTANTCADALEGMLTHAEGDCPFSIWTDRLLEAKFSVNVPSTFRSLLGGVSGSILDVFGPGEYEWDKFTVKFHSHRGRDDSVMIRWGKNMTDVKKTTDSGSIWTGVLPFWSGMDDAQEPVLLMLPERVVYSDAADDFVYKMVIPLDLSSSFENQPTEEQLRNTAQRYVRNNAHTGIPASIEVSFIALWQTEEYKDVAPLQKLRLCDTVTVYHKGLGIENKAKIVSVTYDVLLERYEKMTVGEVKTSLDDSIRTISEEVKKEVPTATSINQAISLAANILTGSRGGNVLINTNSNGQPVEFLVMDTDDITTASHILRINRDGMAVTSEGYTGAYTTVMELDGSIAAEFITGALDAAVIKKGVLTDRQGNVSWNMVNGIFNAGNAEISSLTGDQLAVSEITADTVEASEISADSVRSGDGLTGEFHLPGCTLTVSGGIITGLAKDEPTEPTEPDEPTEPEHENNSENEEGEETP